MKKLSLISLLKESGFDDSYNVGNKQEFWAWAQKAASIIAGKSTNNPHQAMNRMGIGNKFLQDALDLVKDVRGQDGSIQPSPTQEDLDQAKELLLQKYGKFLS